jgi:hypothetical protein
MQAADAPVRPRWASSGEDIRPFFAGDVVSCESASTSAGLHNVDVSARRTVGGIELLWVVECKRWNRRVPKERVAALKAIVDGVGADRVPLMSA